MTTTTEAIQAIYGENLKQMTTDQLGALCWAALDRLASDQGWSEAESPIPVEKLDSPALADLLLLAISPLAYRLGAATESDSPGTASTFPAHSHVSE